MRRLVPSSGPSRLIVALLLAGIAALALAGRTPLARLAFLLDMPRIAAQLGDDPAVRGVALYLSGDYQGADDAFRKAGRGTTYNRGLSLAATGQYALSVAYFDAVLFATPSDSHARDNRNIVNAVLPPQIGEANQAGRIAAKAIATPGGSPVDEVKRLGRPLDVGRRVADMDWLATLPDDPAEFLRLRLAEEYLRRISMGLTPAEEVDPW